MGFWTAAVTSSLHFTNFKIGNFRLSNQHTLWAHRAVQSISINQEALLLTTAVGFQDIDRVDGVSGCPLAVHKLYSHGSIHHHVSKEFCITGGSRLRLTSPYGYIKCVHCLQGQILLVGSKHSILNTTQQKGYTPMILEDIEVLAALIKHSLPRSSVPIVRFSFM